MAYGKISRSPQKSRKEKKQKDKKKEMKTPQNLQYLNLCQTAKESFTAAMDTPKKCLEEYTAMGKISGQPIGVIDWTTV